MPSDFGCPSAICARYSFSIVSIFAASGACSFESTVAAATAAAASGDAARGASTFVLYGW